jgi:hypothetical protein
MEYCLCDFVAVFNRLEVWDASFVLFLSKVDSLMMVLLQATQKVVAADDDLFAEK